MSAPTRRVTNASLSYGAPGLDRAPVQWTLILDCGHPATRRIVRAFGREDLLRFPPRRVRCATCERHAREATS